MMDSQFYDLDINARLPIIRVESLDPHLYNGLLDETEAKPLQNGLVALHHHQDGDSISINNRSKSKNNHHNHNNHNNHHGNNNYSSSNHNSGSNNIQNNDRHPDLPKPTYRLASNSSYKKRKNTASDYRRKEKDKGEFYFIKGSYYHYNPHEQAKGIEYDMDAQDTEWLASFNEKHSKQYNYTVVDSDFEKVMDSLEKESYFESTRSGKDIIPEVDEDAVCAICSNGECTNFNVILFCDMCDLAVHQECYGVPYVPEGQWLCRRCLQSPSANVKCCLCPNMGGAFKQTDDNRWAHVICALWIPEVCFANTVFLEPIDSIDQIPRARWALTCYICKQKKNGACIQCHKPNCYAPFHVTCAQQAGLYMNIEAHKYNTPNGPLADVRKEAYCDAHGPSDWNPERGMYNGGDSEEEDVESLAYKKRQKAKREGMKKARRILAEKREKAFNPVAEPKVKEEKLLAIEKLLSLNRKRKVPQGFVEFRREFVQRVKGYWIEKRKQRNGVPLIRRLQVSYHKPADPKSGDIDRERYKQLRYDFEKARLLVGEVKKRELLKKRLWRESRDIVMKQYELFNIENPPSE